MSSSPKYVPRCTSMKTTSVSPSLAMRCAPSTGMSIDLPASTLVTVPSSVTVAVPETMNQCSARLEWRW